MYMYSRDMSFWSFAMAPSTSAAGFPAASISRRAISISAGSSVLALRKRIDLDPPSGMSLFFFCCVYARL